MTQEEKINQLITEKFNNYENAVQLKKHHALIRKVEGESKFLRYLEEMKPLKPQEVRESVSLLP